MLALSPHSKEGPRFESPVVQGLFWSPPRARVTSLWVLPHPTTVQGRALGGISESTTVNGLGGVNVSGLGCLPLYLNPVMAW